MELVKLATYIHEFLQIVLNANLISVIPVKFCCKMANVKLARITPGQIITRKNVFKITAPLNRFTHLMVHVRTVTCSLDQMMKKQNASKINVLKIKNLPSTENVNLVHLIQDYLQIK